MEKKSRTRFRWREETEERKEQKTEEKDLRWHWSQRQFLWSNVKRKSFTTRNIAHSAMNAGYSCFTPMGTLGGGIHTQSSARRHLLLFPQRLEATHHTQAFWPLLGSASVHITFTQRVFIAIFPAHAPHTPATSNAIFPLIVTVVMNHITRAVNWSPSNSKQNISNTVLRTVD